MANRYIVSDTDPMAAADGNQLRVGDYWSTSAGVVKKLTSTNPFTWEQVIAPSGTIAWANVTGKPATYPPTYASGMVVMVLAADSCTSLGTGWTEQQGLSLVGVKFCKKD